MLNLLQNVGNNPKEQNELTHPLHSLDEEEEEKLVAVISFETNLKGYQKPRMAFLEEEDDAELPTNHTLNVVPPIAVNASSTSGHTIGGQGTRRESSELKLFPTIQLIEDELPSRTTSIQEGEDDEDITAADTRTTSNRPESVVVVPLQGPMTQARALQLNHEVSSLLSVHNHTYEDDMLLSSCTSIKS
ncbi:uncharacterized protein LOC133904871 [Phragmites australis]|uniref:uncharacterized protein LOC133904871 n=1 Tax=Phragmites australis TaxID=29695 RepID=UPI002D78BB55|nr:uncharacterized protein LOC133904871 [Phragmites australis]